MPLLDLIEYLDDSREVMAVRIPQDGEADIKWGSQLIVREGQVAIFYRGGQALDTFGPGRYTLSTGNLPLLGKVIGAAFDGRTPFKAEVVFVDVGLIDDQKWGTKEPIPMRDSMMGVVRLRSFGSLTYRIVDPVLFVNKRLKSSRIYTASDMANWARDAVVQRLIDVIGEIMKSIMDLAGLFDEIATATKARLADDFAKNGLELEDLRIGAITPPPEVQKKIDERSGMGLFENSMGAFQQYQMAYAMRDLAKNSGGDGTAGAGMGMGMGLGMGFMMPGMVAQSMNPGMQAMYGQQGYPPQGAGVGGYPPPPPPQGAAGAMPQQPHQAQMAAGAAAGAAATMAAPGATQTPPQQAPGSSACPKCGYPVGPGLKFCPNCGNPLSELPKVKCVNCGKEIPEGSKFCPFCGATQHAQAAPHCVTCGKEIMPGMKFCPYCGSAQPV